MTDLVERLRRERETDHLCVEAADEIEQLRAVLFDIAYRGHDNCRSGPKSCIWLMQVTARRALEPKP